MFRSYLGVAAILSLAAVVGCDSSSSAGGSGGSAGTGGMGGEGGSAGAGGSAGMGGMGGEGGAGGVAPIAQAISLGCTNNVTEDISILDWELTVSPDGDVTGDAEFTATLGGTANFAESFLDAAQAVVPGGVKQAALAGLSATVLVRSGATGDPVTLKPADIPFSCALDTTVTCDPAMSEETGANPACIPTGGFNQCLQFVIIPTSDDCAAGGECETLGKASQCETNLFCVTGPLPLELEPDTGTYTADAAGDILFGWDDQNTGATLNGDGTYALPQAIFGETTDPNGLRVIALLQVALQCTMAVDSGGDDGVAVPDQASPTPDSALLVIPIL